MRIDLPPDCHRSLDYASTIEPLKLLEGEELSSSSRVARAW
jgi:hypothetical protein